MPSTEQLDTLRAMLAADFDRHGDLATQLDQTGGWEGYGILVGAAFFLGVRKRFSSEHTLSDLIQFAADVRARFDLTGDKFDQRAMELTMRAALGERGLGSQLSDNEKLQAQLIILSALAVDGSLGDPDTFLNDEVVPLATKWGA